MDKVPSEGLGSEVSGVPGRFRPMRQLGRGGGGVVYAAHDQATNQAVAIKVLHAEASGAESEALIRETITLSGLEGLGFPRVLRLGRTLDGRAFLVREMVDGTPLDRVQETEPARVPALICEVADALSVVHRAGTLHGDVKPANVIVRPDGGVSLVDLGLATALREGGGFSTGLTPYYAAPEVSRGEALSPQGEVYSLGVMLSDALDQPQRGIASQQARAAREVAHRATAARQSDRFPSTDEFSQALRTALGGDAPLARSGSSWPILGVEAVAHAVARAVEALPSGGALVLLGPPRSGVSTLLCRVGWSASLEGTVVGYIDEGSAGTPFAREEVERACREGALLIVDARVELGGEDLERVQKSGARLIIAEQQGKKVRARSPTAVFEVPPLSVPIARQLLFAVLPGLSESLFEHLFEKTGRRPGALRSFVDAAGGMPLAGKSDVDAILEGSDLAGADPLRGAMVSLERGHYQTAATHLAKLTDDDPRVVWLKARYQLAAGTAEEALRQARRALDLFDACTTCPEPAREQLLATWGRALLGVGRYSEALESLAAAEDFPIGVRSEALAYRGLCQTLLGQGAAALETLQVAVQEARTVRSERLAALALSCLATAQWRQGETDAAAASYRSAIEVATAAGDAGMLASCLINLAGLLKERGELAESVRALEASVDAAQRSGRLASLHQALLNLSNADLYLGRLERARAALSRVGPPDSLIPTLRAQLFGLRAELAVRTSARDEALQEYERCEKAWAALGRSQDAAEAALESVLAASHAPDESTHHGALVGELERAEKAVQRGRDFLNGQTTALLRLAEARVAVLAGRPGEAEKLAVQAAEMATESGQKEWAWRAVALEAELALEAGKPTRAMRARERAVEILEEIAARLPEDLRAVFWNEPRRAHLRMDVTRHSVRPGGGLAAPGSKSKITRSGADALSQVSQTPLERRLARILAINGDLAAEVELPRLMEKIVAHAAELLGAERGFLLLGTSADELKVSAARGGQGREHEDFSRSIARQVLAEGKPLVSVDAERDLRLKAFESVHLDLIRAVACVPVMSPQGAPVGALYLETRAGARPDFGDELSTLQAFADQVAIALENARLLSALEEKSRALEKQNVQLAEAQERLRELLGRRTARLREVRKELRTTRGKLESHSAYAGLVGASAQMRRIFQLIDRIKDTDVPVLITGESGTGKEMVARAIYQGSVRSRAPMQAVNCGAIPQSILESELFGHVRGAFTGADRERRGLFREADGGVLFLDEIGETPLKMQASLLRVLQEGLVRPVGGNAELPVDVRVIFATNRDLTDAVSAGLFREDLLYRIRVVELELPPLRERRDDIPLLIDHFLDRFAVRFDQPKKVIRRDALDVIMSHPLPGNVRQLENVLLNAWVLSEGDQIGASDLALPAPPGSLPPPRPMTPVPSKESKPLHRGTLSEHQREERARMVGALEKCGWNRALAARHIGMPRRTFYRRLKEYGLQH